MAPAAAATARFDALIHVEGTLRSVARAAVVPLSPLRSLQALVGDLRGSLPPLRQVLVGARAAASGIGAGDEKLPDEVRPQLFMAADEWDEIAVGLEHNAAKVEHIRWVPRFGRRQARSYSTMTREMAGITREIARTCREIASKDWDPSEHEAGLSAEARAALDEGMRDFRAGRFTVSH